MAIDLLSIVPDDPKDVIFWTGAGISLDSPSNLPSGWSLTEDVVNKFCIDGTWKKLRDYLRKADIDDANGNIKEIPRLESIFGSAVSMLGYNDALECLNEFDTIPNTIHHFFAHHISAGGKHVTLNLDLCIKKAINISVPHAEYNIIDPEDDSIDHSKEGLILHLHGRIGNSYKKLGITIESITYGVSQQIKLLLLKLLKEKSAIIFCGYSGSDFFDVNPFFRNLKGEIELYDKNIIWIDHTDKEDVLTTYHGSKTKKDILDSLSSCNANVYVYKTKTINVIKKLSTQWSFPSADITDKGKKIEMIIDLEEWKKALVTAKIFVSMGLGVEVLKMTPRIVEYIDDYKKYCDSKSDLDEFSAENRILYIINEAMREVGLYQDANKISHKIVRQSKLDNLFFFERTASDLWLIGKLFSSLRFFKEGLEYGENNLGKSSKFDSVYIECLRGYMQCCRDIGRIPFVGYFLMKRKIKLALDYLCKKAIEAALKRSPYDLSHIKRLFSWEYPEIAKTNTIPSYLADETNIIHVFSETDNFLGVINSKRSEVVRKINSKEPVSEEEIAKLIWLSAIIGNHPGIVKACNLIQANILPDSFSTTQYSLIRIIEQLFEMIKGAVKAILKILSNKCIKK